MLSFFDEGDEPRTAIGSPPPRPGPSSRSRPGRRARADERTVLARRAGALGVAVVVVAIVYFVINAYLASQNTQALKDYNSEVTTLVQGEQTTVEQPFFASLEGAPGTGGGPLMTLEDDLYQDYVSAKMDAQTAAAWSVPSGMAGAQQDLLLVLDLRAEALLKVWQQIGGALQGGSFTALRNIAGAMQMIAASDTVYAVRVQPLIQEGLSNDGIAVASSANLGGEVVPGSQFLPNQSWTLAGYVAGKILGATPPQLGGSLGAGSHGHAIVSVMAGSTALNPYTGSNINPVPYTNNLQYVVTFTNDGENDEFGVITKLTLSSASTQTQVAETTTRETKPGQQVMATLGFSTAPPPNTTLQLTAEVVPVTGESDTTNNKLTFLIEFTH